MDSGAGHRARYGVLGPVVVGLAEAVRPADPDAAPRAWHAPPGAKQRALLAVLLVHRDEAVPVDRLVDELWADAPPAGAPGALQAHVSKLRGFLRKVTGTEPLQTRPQGYALHVPRGALDLDRFAGLVAAACDAPPAADAGDEPEPAVRARATALVELGTLAPADAVTLLAIAAGAERLDDPADAEALAELCGRPPLALRIAGARLAAKAHWTAATLARRLGRDGGLLDELVAGDLAVRDRIELGYRAASARQQRLFRLLGATRAADVSAAVAGALLGVPAAEAEAELAGLVDLHLLTCADGAGTAGFRLPPLVGALARELAAHP